MFPKPIKSVVLSLLFMSLLSSCGGIFSTTKHYISYPVKPGDTLYAVGDRFEVSPEKLQKINKISDPEKLAIGGELLIPYSGQSLKKKKNDLDSSFSLRKLRPSFHWKRGKRISLGEAKEYVGNLAWPVAHTNSSKKFSSQFGRRFGRFHEGVDLSAPNGTPVVAAHSGKVVYSGNGLRGYGNIVVVQAENILTVYAHHRKNKVKVGKLVKKGDVIAEVGATGRATGPHLHFETRIRDKEGRHVAVSPSIFFN